MEIEIAQLFIQKGKRQDARALIALTWIVEMDLKQKCFLFNLIFVFFLLYLVSSLVYNT